MEDFSIQHTHARFSLRRQLGSVRRLCEGTFADMMAAAMKHCCFDGCVFSRSIVVVRWPPIGRGGVFASARAPLHLYWIFCGRAFLA